MSSPPKDSRIPAAGRRRLALCARLLPLVVGAAAVGVTASSPDHPPTRVSKFDAAVHSRTSDPQADDSTRVIIRTRSSETTAALKDRLEQHGDTVHLEHPFIHAVTATVQTQDLPALAADDSVESVSIDAVVEASDAASSSPLAVTSDVVRATLGISKTSPTGAGVGVAIVDSGIANIPDLHAQIRAFFDFTQGGRASAPYDDYGHGTHLAGLIASSGVQTQGAYPGIAPQVSLVGLKVLDANGQGNTSTVIAAIEFAIANKAALGIDILNLSLGHPIQETAATDPLVQAVEQAVRAGIVVVVAAGNYGRNPTTGAAGYAGITSPGNAPSAITVGALNTNGTIVRTDDTVPSYSSRGPTWYDAFAKPDLIAPGQALVSDISNGTLIQQYPSLAVQMPKGSSGIFMTLSGTSMAAGVASGVVALMVDANRRASPRPLPPNAIKAILEFTALPLPTVDALTQGAGGVNAAAAVEVAQSVNPSTAVGTWWATTGLAPTTLIGAQTLTWGQTVVWGTSLLTGNAVYYNEPAWATTVVWGNTVVWGTTVVSGTNVVWTNPSVWSSTVVWGTSLIGATSGSTVVWGTTQVTPLTVVWGTLAPLTGPSGSLSLATLQP